MSPRTPLGVVRMENASRNAPLPHGSGPGSPKLVTVVQGLVLMLVVLLVTLASLELCVRAWRHLRGQALSPYNQTLAALRKQWPTIAVPDAGRIFELRPDAHQIFRGDEFEIDLRINSRRLRDRAHSLQKPPGTYRILALGDSFTFGWGVEARDAWWAHLGTLMAHRMSPVPVEVINLGVYFYTFDQQVQRLQELGLAYHPDLIVVGFYYPHVVTIATHTYEQQGSKPWPRIVDPTIYVDGEGLLRSGRPVPFEDLRRQSALADLVLSRYKRIRYSYSPAGRLHEFGLVEEAQEGKFRHLWDLTRGAYATLMQVAGQQGIPVLVFEIPRDFQVWPKWKKAVALPPAADLRSRLPQEKFARICDELSMTCLDLRPRFAEAASRRPEDPLYYAIDPHWTPAGHRLAAQVIFEYLNSHEMAREVHH